MTAEVANIFQDYNGYNKIWAKRAERILPIFGVKILLKFAEACLRQLIERRWAPLLYLRPVRSIVYAM